VRPRILIVEPFDFSPVALSRLREQADVELREVSRSELKDAFMSYDVVWQRLAHRIDSEVIGVRPRCRVVATPVTGIDHIDLPACEAAGIKVVSLKGEVEFLKQVRATAELTVGLAIGVMRRIPASMGSVLEGEWRRDLFRGNELFGKTVGIIGVGRLGTLVAGYFRAFGMEVLGFDVRSDFPEEITRVDLPELLRRSDLVTLHVSLNDSTRMMFGTRELAGMKPGAWLVNTARGEVIDEAALLGALERGHLRGAALDVLTGEPGVDGKHPVVAYARSHSNLLIAPHIGGNTFESFEKTELFLAGRVLQVFQ